MKATGPRSVSSFLVTVFTASWYTIAAVLAVMVVLVLAGSSVAVQMKPDGAPNVDITV